MEEFEPQSAQGTAHQAYIDAVDALEEARELGDEPAIRAASVEVARTKKEWHRLVRLAEDALDKRGT